jgi:hypothetical protein
LRPKFCRSFRPPNERAQGRPGARCTRGLVCKLHRKMRTRAYRFSGEHPAFPAQWLYGLLRTLPGEPALLPPSLRRNESTQLDASIGASGPHDFTVRLMRVRLRTFGVHRDPSLVRDDGQRPSERDGIAKNVPLFWG